MDITCKFAASGGAKACEKAAAKFVRAHKTGRLIPLCGPCLKSFEDASSRLKQSPAADRPEALSDPAYELVELADGEQEWKDQPAKA